MSYVYKLSTESSISILPTNIESDSPTGQNWLRFPSPRKRNQATSSNNNNNINSNYSDSTNSTSSISYTNVGFIYRTIRCLMRRLILTLLICPSYFFSAFLWEFAGLTAIHYLHLTTYDFVYFILTGNHDLFSLFRLCQSISFGKLSSTVLCTFEYYYINLCHFH